MPKKKKEIEKEEKDEGVDLADDLDPEDEEEEEEEIEEEDEELEDDLPPDDDDEEEVDDKDDKYDAIPSEAAKMVGDVPVQVVAVLGKKTISVKELVDLRLGNVMDLARPINEMVDLVAGGKLVAKGELVDIDGKMGVKVVKVLR